MTFATIAAGLSIAALALLLLRGWGMRRLLGTLLLGLLAMSLLLAFMLDPAMSLVYQGLGAVALIPLLLLHPRKQSWEFLGACAMAVAVATTFYYQSTVSASALGVHLPLRNAVFSGGEMMAVAAPFLLLLGRRFKAWLVPLALLPAIGFYLVSSSPFVSLVATWTVYITLFLPLPVYAAALGAFVYVLADMLRSGSHRWMGLGLLMVAIGGRMFQTAYLAHLSLLGLLLFVLPLTALMTESPEEARSLALGAAADSPLAESGGTR